MLGGDSTSKRTLVLHELQRTRERNQKVLKDLRTELEDFRSSSIAAADSNNNPQPMPLVQMPPNINYPLLPPGVMYPSGQVPYGRHNLASEANLLKHEYLALGGSDPRLIHQMNDLIGQSLLMQHQMQQHFGGRTNQKSSQQNDQITLKILEDYKTENDRLRAQLEEIKNKKLSEKDDLSSLRKDHIIKMTAMKQELEQLEQAARIDSLKNQIRQIKTGPSKREGMKEKGTELTKGGRDPLNVPQPSLPLIDILASAPYDPSTGFMIYHDFILNVDPTFKRLKVMATLMRGKSHLGAAVPLPTRDCLALHGESYHSAYLHCLVNIKQPVTRCLPAEDLCLLIEVLGNSYYDEQFKPVCWAKFLLFDDQHRVISGRWKVPLRIVPSRPDIHPKDTNNIPQSGRMEYFYRICNSRDTPVQNKVASTPTQSHHYMYAPTDDGKTN